MKLAQYLELRGLTGQAFAAQAGLSQSTISRILNAGQMPTIETALHIQRATKGEVTPTDFVNGKRRVA